MWTWPAAGEATADAVNSSTLKKADATAKQPIPIDEAVFIARSPNKTSDPPTGT